VALLGANGSGKSTLLRAVLGLVRPAAGTVRVFERDPVREFDAIRSRVGAVLQDVDAQLLAPTVREDLAFGLDGRGLSKDEIRERVGAVARRFGLEAMLDKVPHYLSGGEKRKVALAGALVTEPDVLVLDEPFAGLDPESIHELVQLLQAASAHRRLTLLLATHDVRELPVLVDAVYVLSRDGTLLVRDRPDAVFGMQDLLAASNVDVPPLARLLAALRRRGVHVGQEALTSDPDALADLLASRITPREGTMSR
jgi:cobalt/nickel transport system ATP-binding protein